jgi:small neutral amino acid transporter SnatA (MarC family)
MEVNMKRRERTRILLGIIFILLGVWWLAAQWFPDLAIWESLNFSWPWIIIGVGLLLFFIGLLGGESDMAVPACVVTGIGGILYYQDLTGDWGSWSYAWALIPGFVGVGVFLAALLKGDLNKQFKEALRLIIISLLLFAVFGSFLGGLEWAGVAGALALILVGLYMILRFFFQPKTKEVTEEPAAPAPSQDEPPPPPG